MRASAQQNTHMCHLAQLLVDQKWFTAVLLGFNEQLHSKNQCDQRFGGYTQAWKRSVIISLEDMMRAVEETPFAEPPDRKDRPHAVPPEAMTDWTAHTTPRFLRVDHLSRTGTGRNIHLIAFGHDMSALSDTPIRLRSADGSIEETSVRAEIQRLCVPMDQPGFARGWTLPPVCAGPVQVEDGAPAVTVGADGDGGVTIDAQTAAAPVVLMPSYCSLEVKHFDYQLWGPRSRFVPLNSRESVKGADKMRVTKTVKTKLGYNVFKQQEHYGPELDHRSVDKRKQLYPAQYGKEGTDAYIRRENAIVRGSGTCALWPTRIFARSDPISAPDQALVPQPDDDGNQTVFHLTAQEKADSCHAEVIAQFEALDTSQDINRQGTIRDIFAYICREYYKTPLDASAVRTGPAPNAGEWTATRVHVPRSYMCVRLIVR